MIVDSVKRWKLCGSVCDFIPRLRRFASITLVVVLGCGAKGLANEDQSYITAEKAEGRFRLSSGGSSAPLHASSADHAGVLRVLRHLQADIAAVTGARPAMVLDSVSAGTKIVMAGSKWQHMMDQTHIGYTYRQQPDENIMPEVREITIAGPRQSHVSVLAVVSNPASPRPDDLVGFVESNGYVSIEAEHFTRKVESAGITWQRIPDRSGGEN